METDLINLSKTFKKKGFSSYVSKDRDEALQIVNKIISDASPIGSIGLGNSESLRQLGLDKSLLQYTKNLYVHLSGMKGTDEKKALTADFYLCSANAVSQDGHIINIDGTGNRTAATCFGPNHLIYIIGKNKIANTLDDAIYRAKNIAAVTIAKKCNRNTPCVVTGKCEDCDSSDCICSVMTIHRRKPLGMDVSIILVNEDLGV